MNDQKQCPFCGSDDLSTGSWCIDDDEAHELVKPGELGEVPSIECNRCLGSAPSENWNRRAYDIAPGMIIMWSGSLASLPADWILCDGTSGTPDMRDYFVEIAPTGGEGVASGDNTIAISGAGSSVSHEHRGVGASSQNYRVNLNHSNSKGHTHSISSSGAWTPPLFALAFLMYSP